MLFGRIATTGSNSFDLFLTLDERLQQATEIKFIASGKTVFMAVLCNLKTVVMARIDQLL
jgi:hypothetical protein